MKYSEKWLAEDFDWSQSPETVEEWGYDPAGREMQYCLRFARAADLIVLAMKRAEHEMGPPHR
jgi:hypothetical protein